MKRPNCGRCKKEIHKGSAYAWHAKHYCEFHIGEVWAEHDKELEDRKASNKVLQDEMA